jgi:outer membrane biosynthesis protein TonB
MNFIDASLVNLKLNIKDSQKRIYFIAFLLSAIFHVILLLLFNNMLNFNFPIENNSHENEMVVLFPENKPKQIVENINENNERPLNSDLLSDKDSRARNNKLLENTQNQPYSEGNIPYTNLSQPNFESIITKNQSNKKFSRDALRGGNSQPSQSYTIDNPNLSQQSPSIKQPQSTNNFYDQKEFSADQLGDLSLSTYAWEWAPYINALKKKLRQVWFAPAAYYRLGLIYGYTVIVFTISREGKILKYKVLEHKGHESLENSSVNAINALFPFKPLPAHFPEETLTITARLIYPNLREGRN